MLLAVDRREFSRWADQYCFVMPLVFGGAPIVNTLLTVMRQGTAVLHPLFYSGLTLLIAGAVMALVSTPRQDAPARKRRGRKRRQEPARKEDTTLPPSAEPPAVDS